MTRSRDGKPVVGNLESTSLSAPGLRRVVAFVVPVAGENTAVSEASSWTLEGVVCILRYEITLYIETQRHSIFSST